MSSNAVDSTGHYTCGISSGRFRRAILEGLGWNIQHLWSTDWWHDPAAQTKKLLATLETLKAKERKTGAK